MYSDNNPLFIRLNSHGPRLGDRPFRFKAAWISHPDFNELVKQNWISSEGSVVPRLV